MAGEPIEIAVVVRYTGYERATPEQCVSLIGWFHDPAVADQEAARLNRVRPNEGVSYFVKIVRDRRGEGLPPEPPR
jgi:hypothetical protein